MVARQLVSILTVGCCGCLFILEHLLDLWPWELIQESDLGTSAAKNLSHCVTLIGIASLSPAALRANCRWDFSLLYKGRPQVMALKTPTSLQTVTDGISNALSPNQGELKTAHSNLVPILEET